MSTAASSHFVGLAQASKHFRTKLSRRSWRQLRALDTTFAVLRHITQASCDKLEADICRELYGACDAANDSESDTSVAFQECDAQTTVSMQTHAMYEVRADTHTMCQPFPKTAEPGFQTNPAQLASATAAREENVPKAAQPGSPTTGSCQFATPSTALPSPTCDRFFIGDDDDSNDAEETEVFGLVVSELAYPPLAHDVAGDAEDNTVSYADIMRVLLDTLATARMMSVHSTDRDLDSMD